MNISAPGIYRDFPLESYAIDPCPTPSLTQSMAKILLDRSPLHAWWQHPRLNPDFAREDDTKFDIGVVAHRLLLGRGKVIEVLDYDDWRTKDAQQARRTAAANGQLGVLRKHYELTLEMVRVAHTTLDACDCATAFSGAGHSEVILAWREGAVWCRGLVDWMCGTHLIYDYKTTGISCAPHTVDRLMVQAGWDIQAAMYERGLNALDPENIGRRTFRFLVQENEPPYAATLCELSEAALTMGRKKIEVALRIWRDCMERNQWPGYPSSVLRPQYPGWAESAWLDREQSEFVNLLAAG